MNELVEKKGKMDQSKEVTGHKVEERGELQD